MIPPRRRFGMGFDLRHGDPHGFVFAPGPFAGASAAPRLSPRIAALLSHEAASLDYAFFSFQPMDRSLLSPERYFPAWDAVFEAAPAPALRGLHHTMLNLGTLAPTEERGRLLAFTNAMIERYGFAWVNEDLGQWSLDGKQLPYPLPPILTEAGLRRAIRHVTAVQAQLAAPLVVEFPGFSEGTNFVLGSLHAYDFFRRLAEETGVAVTLDTGHLLSYQWLLGRRGPALFDELERLPLAHCFEVHCSGCQVIDDRFVDVHHGVLRPEQLTMLARLLAACPALQCVAYEDPKPDEHGRLRPKARAGYEQLRALVSTWAAAGVPGGGGQPRPPVGDAPDLGSDRRRGAVSRATFASRVRMAAGSVVGVVEPDPADDAEADVLRRLLFDPGMRARFVSGGSDTLPPELDAQAPLLALTERAQVAATARRMASDLRSRQTRGLGSPAEVFAEPLAEWQALHADSNLDALFADFLASPHFASVNELPDRSTGTCLEEGFFRFLEVREIGSAAARERSFLGALARLLAITPEPSFSVPPELRRTPRGWVAVAAREAPPRLFAAVDDRYVTGLATPAIVERLEAPGRAPDDLLSHRLRTLGLIG